MMSHMQKLPFSRKRRGASLTGYGLLLGLIGIAAIVAVQEVGEDIAELFGGVSEQMESAGTGGGGSGGGGDETPSSPATVSALQGSVSELDVTGPGNPATGTPVVLTFTNEGNQATGTLTTGLDDDTNFFISGDSCNGNSLAGGDSCQIEITPRATVDGSFMATLTVTDGTLSTETILSGTASGFTPQGEGNSWGGAQYGKLGNNTFSPDQDSPQTIFGDHDWADISAGYLHSCGIDMDGDAWCWGYAADGQLGNGTTSPNQSGPQLVSGEHNWLMVSAGGSHNCGIVSGGDAWCWGRASFGRLGNGTGSPDQSNPVAVSGERSWVTVSVGGSHSCGIDTDGDALCWGSASLGQLGNGSTTPDRTSPQPVSGPHSWVEISTGNIHSCGIDTNGDAWCWGSAIHGRLGNGISLPSADIYSTPQAVDSDQSWISISAGGGHSCGIDTTGNAWCWGLSGNGQLGNEETTPNRSSPQLVSSSQNWLAVSAGILHSCGIDANGDTWCWGAAANGRLGNGSTSPDQTSPVLVTGEGSWTKISAGELHTLAIGQ